MVPRTAVPSTGPLCRLRSEPKSRGLVEWPRGDAEPTKYWVLDYEGLVAKDEASLYVAGPTRRGLKVTQKGWSDVEDGWRRWISTAPQHLT